MDIQRRHLDRLELAHSHAASQKTLMCWLTDDPLKHDHTDPKYQAQQQQQLRQSCQQELDGLPRQRPAPQRTASDMDLLGMMDSQPGSYPGGLPAAHRASASGAPGGLHPATSNSNFGSRSRLHRHSCTGQLPSQCTQAQPKHSPLLVTPDINEHPDSPSQPLHAPLLPTSRPASSFLAGCGDGFEVCVAPMSKLFHAPNIKGLEDHDPHAGPRGLQLRACTWLHGEQAGQGCARKQQPCAPRSHAGSRSISRTASGAGRSLHRLHWSVHRGNHGDGDGHQQADQDLDSAGSSGCFAQALAGAWSCSGGSREAHLPRPPSLLGASHARASESGSCGCTADVSVHSMCQSATELPWYAWSDAEEVHSQASTAHTAGCSAHARELPCFQRHTSLRRLMAVTPSGMARARSEAKHSWAGTACDGAESMHLHQPQLLPASSTELPASVACTACQLELGPCSGPVCCDGGSRGGSCHGRPRSRMTCSSSYLQGLTEPCSASSLCSLVQEPKGSLYAEAPAPRSCDLRTPGSHKSGLQPHPPPKGLYATASHAAVVTPRSMTQVASSPALTHRTYQLPLQPSPLPPPSPLPLLPPQQEVEPPHAAVMQRRLQHAEGQVEGQEAAPSNPGPGLSLKHAPRQMHHDRSQGALSKDGDSGPLMPSSFKHPPRFGFGSWSKEA